MNNQEVYENIRIHFTQPGAKFGMQKTTDYPVGECVYRGNRDPNSPIRCAFGCLIPNELYLPEMEGRWAEEVIGSDSDLRERFPDTDFIARAQNLHDDCARNGKSITHFISLLDKLAEQRDLDVVVT